MYYESCRHLVGGFSTRAHPSQFHVLSYSSHLSFFPILPFPSLSIGRLQCVDVTILWDIWNRTLPKPGLIHPLCFMQPYRASIYHVSIFGTRSSIAFQLQVNNNYSHSLHSCFRVHSKVYWRGRVVFRKNGEYQRLIVQTNTTMSVYYYYLHKKAFTLFPCLKTATFIPVCFTNQIVCV